MSRKKPETTLTSRERRAVLRRIGRFAAVSAPTVTLLLAAESKPASAQPYCATMAGPGKINIG
jgi:hypothetical protein